MRQFRRPADWTLDAACIEADPELFFAPDGESDTARIIREQAAKAVCAGCLVRAECAITGAAEEHGTWSGGTEDERRLDRPEVA